MALAPSLLPELVPPTAAAAAVNDDIDDKAALVLAGLAVSLPSARGVRLPADDAGDEPPTLADVLGAHSLDMFRESEERDGLRPGGAVSGG